MCQNCNQPEELTLFYLEASTTDDRIGVSLVTGVSSGEVIDDFLENYEEETGEEFDGEIELIPIKTVPMSFPAWFDQQ